VSQNVRSPDRLQRHLQRASAFIKRRRFDLAAREALHALQADAQSADAHHYLALALWGQDKWQPAKRAAEAALRLDAERPEFHSTLACVLPGSGRGWPKRAQEHHLRAIELRPSEPLFHWRYGDFLWHYGRYLRFEGEAKAAWEESAVCLRLEPGFAEAHFLQAQILFARQDYAAAEKSLLAALSIAPRFVQAQALLGDVYLNTHRGGPAAACYRTALRLEPTNRPLKRAVVLALEAQMPVLGVFWRLSLGLDRPAGRLGVSAGLLLLAWAGVCLVSQGDFGSSLVTCLYCAPIVLPMALLTWGVDPFLTWAFQKGWININESAARGKNGGLNAMLGRLVQWPILLLMIILVLLCSMVLFWNLGAGSH
jgi:tetratricopeptide (TPR) repeat protein